MTCVCVTVRNITQWLIPFPLEQRGQKEKEFWSSKTERGGEQWVPGLLCSSGDLSNPSHILVFIIPLQVPGLFANYLFFCLPCSKQSSALHLDLPILPLIITFLSHQGSVSSICCSDLHPFPSFLSASLDLGRPSSPTSGFRILCPLLIYL